MIREFAADGHTVVHGDAIEGLKSIDTSSIDLIFADPPYNIGKDFDGIHDRVDEAEYLDWCWKWLEECYRVLKPTGTFYLMNSTQNMPHMDIYCRKRFEILSRIVWSYDSSGMQARKFYGSLYEPILHMVKDPKAYTFNADDILVEAKTGAKRGLIDYRKDPPQPYNTTKVPGNVWDFARVRFKMDEYENHPSQKPEALLERVIRASSNPGDLVLDPFGGSFSTGAVAKRLGRRSISIEKNEAYIKIGLRRIGIPSDYPEEDLMKQKTRKTQNLSKRQRDKDSVQQPILQLEL
ncbi:adenine-specific DNA-methyltransferase [Stenotrophomonas maltophilia]|uniref:adenine-specific DNA-methyltransferase n=1 Tax=Stenotrophomonas maltophilia TaxID=40324 RepID=UPI0015DEA56F|nr:adenine-specific DNA-methyltransferase [Stenotrophomonas maltophilia]HEL4773735.1 adenine-specific DNA-methyltransferase [Stenotrophomonas maltophilia]